MISSFCGGGGCVDVEFGNGVVRVRNTRAPSLRLVFTRAAWDAFVARVKAGEFDVEGDVDS